MLYNAISYLAWFALRCMSPFNKKLKDYTQGRKSVITAGIKHPIWFHCASVGEFEQARPLIELIKQKNSSQKILVTFFSPSGYNQFKNFSIADEVCYSPFETPHQVKTFLNSYEPRALILVKYEFWRNMIKHSHSAGIPIYSVASIFRSDQRFFGPIKNLFNPTLKRIDHFFVQNTNSENLLSKIGINNVSVIGDTRFDRVIQIAQKSQKIESIKNFCQNSKVLVAGSTWPSDEILLEKYFVELKDWKFIIAPHDVQNSRIEEVLNTFKNHESIVYSGAKAEDLKTSKVLLIDSIGMLNRIYVEADLCYVGGAFGAGLHNILEAAVYGKPIIHGPKFEKFQEAIDILEKGGSYKISSSKEDKKPVLEIFNSSELRLKMGTTAKEYVYENLGASDKVISHLKKEGIL